MGKSSKPISILVHPSLWDAPEIVKLRDQGHIVDRLETPVQGLLTYDAILGPNCWRMTPDMTKYIDEAKAEIWATKYPKEPK